jgi:hypothetical protein
MRVILYGGSTMLFLENNHNQFAQQLSDLRKELVKYTEKRYGLTQESLEAMDYAMSLVEDEDFTHFDFNVLLAEIKASLSVYFKRDEAEDALIEYWEGKFLPKKKPCRKILKGIPDRSNQLQE